MERRCRQEYDPDKKTWSCACGTPGCKKTR